MHFRKKAGLAACFRQVYTRIWSLGVGSSPLWGLSRIGKGGVVLAGRVLKATGRLWVVIDRA